MPLNGLWGEENLRRTVLPTGLTIFTQERPDTPTVAEAVPGFEAVSWNGIGAPKKTPADIVASLNKEINAALADPAIKARLTQLGGTPSPMATIDFEHFIVTETNKWTEVVHKAGITVQ